MTRIFSPTGIGICQKDNVRLIPIKNNIQILLIIKKDFIKISPYEIYTYEICRQSGNKNIKKLFIN